MATKIRLQRHGRKKAPFYHIVITDSRAKRDGKFIEKIGTYNPITDPATIDLKFDRALHWIKVGAQPTDTARALLSYKGVLMKDHLDRGVKKGALTEEQADKKFAHWMKEKEAKIAAKADTIKQEKATAATAQLAKETEQKEAKAAEVAAKIAPEPAPEPVKEVADSTADTPEQEAQTAAGEPSSEEQG